MKKYLLDIWGKLKNFKKYRLYIFNIVIFFLGACLLCGFFSDTFWDTVILLVVIL